MIDNRIDNFYEEQRAKVHYIWQSLFNGIRLVSLDFFREIILQRLVREIAVSRRMRHSRILKTASSILRDVHVKDIDFTASLFVSW